MEENGKFFKHKEVAQHKKIPALDLRNSDFRGSALILFDTRVLVSWAYTVGKRK